MVDLATLTGAIMVALGTEHAGLFSNNDELAERLSKTGTETGEKGWRMPLGPEYYKQIDSQFADMKNTGTRNGCSITAAQFLQRFVVQSTSPERTDALDAHLWTYSDESFLPHATWRAGDAQDQPIILSIEEGNPNRANVRFLIDNAGLPADSDSYERLVLVFNGEDADALAAARESWTACKA